jgi:predicted ATPase
MIKKICIENYKSIQKLKLELGRITVLIGENGGGKSNILEAIALGAAATATGAATGDKLYDEFLAPRGIRETEPQLMRSAFEQKNVTEEIKISFFEDEEVYFDCILQNENKPYAKWTKKLPFSLIPFSEEEKLLSDLEKTFNDQESINALNSVKAERQLKHLTLSHLKFSVEGFLIYSPAYDCLHNFKEPGQIQPLGIHGEGLFKLLQVLSLDANIDKLNELKEKLKLMGWFKDFQIPPNLFIGEKTLQIEDRYLAKKLTFDQRSTNEGFLFLLFYFCLFISEDTPPFFSIDNIDVSFNPKLCRRLIKELVNLAKKYDKQVILTTHNPAILDGLNLDDDEQRLFIVSRNKSGYTRAKRFLKPETPEGEKLVRMSEAFLRGYLGGLPKSF